MKQDLENRLSILETAGAVSKRAVLSVEYFVNLLENEFSMDLSEDNGAMLVTHLAMALTRIEKGEDIEMMAPELLEEVKEHRCYTDLEPLLRIMENYSKLKIPSAERGYLALHLITVLEKAKGERDC